MLRACIGRVEDVVAGELREFAITGVRWPVIATVIDDEIVVTAGVCPHEDVALIDGELRGTRLVCPGHAYEFDLRTGRCQHDASLELRRYRVDIIGGEIWIELL
jgi:nitrite reductase/ring-hydroxylating ferredoxin subunit